MSKILTLFGVVDNLAGGSSTKDKKWIHHR